MPCSETQSQQRRAGRSLRRSGTIVPLHYEDVFERSANSNRSRSNYRYGLQTAFSEIERLSHEVTSSGNPIEMDLKTRYVVKGIDKEQIMDSKVKIHTEGDKISRVEDWWGGELNEGPIKNVSRSVSMQEGLRQEWGSYEWLLI